MVFFKSSFSCADVATVVGISLSQLPSFLCHCLNVREQSLFLIHENIHFNVIFDYLLSDYSL